MFSIAAINDSDSKEHWEPLAPTKEAQEFHLSQTYHEGLQKLQAKEYDKARQLLETVLKDPLISSPQVDSSASDTHLLQLRFLALKNLAAVFLQQGSTHHQSALRCYLQAVEIDAKDSVVWNQLGTLSCSMGLMSISRWAFEQGLLCSPNNWNCMEKLLEVLIAIGDEVACLSVSGLILRHWPSHSRALHVKKTIEESEPVPFAPRGIDKLEPKHVRLKFLDKRKATDENVDEGVALKKPNQNIELQLTEVSWAALADALLKIMLPETSSEKVYRFGDFRVIIHFPSCVENVYSQLPNQSSEISSADDCNNSRSSMDKEKETIMVDGQSQERRSTRLERLRTRKPEKENSNFSNDENPGKSVLRILESFITGRPETEDSNYDGSCSVFPDKTASLDSEYNDVSSFVEENSTNYGVYHLAHLLLERASSRNVRNRDAFAKFLELEKLTRHCGQDRHPECNLFLAELYYDLGSLRSNLLKKSEFLSDASYHLCKIIESVALDCSFDLTHVSGDKNQTFPGNDIPDNSIFQNSRLADSLSTNKYFFWVRYFWLSGKLSILDGNKVKAHREYCISLSLLLKKEELNISNTVHLPHCKICGELTIDKVLHEINLLRVDFLLEKTVGEMIEKEMYMECINMLAPLLFSSSDFNLGVSSISNTDAKGTKFTYVELSALDILIKASEKAKPMDAEVYLICHLRKLQILSVLAGIDEWISLCKPFNQKLGLKMNLPSEMISEENSNTHWNQLLVEQVEETFQCVSKVKNCIDKFGVSNGIVIQMSRLSDIQALLLAVMCNVASNFLCKKSSGVSNADQTEQKYICCFIHAAISFCKIQHLDPTVPIKTQVDLIITLHGLLAEYGLCCAGEGGEGEEGTFLKFAIKHLLALDMKLKSNSSCSKGETFQCNDQHHETVSAERSPQKSNADILETEMVEAHTDRASVFEKEFFEPKFASSHLGIEKNNLLENEMQCDCDDTNEGENPKSQHIESTNELAEDEREELEEMLDNALDQCFFCLYGLNLRSDSSYEDDLAVHKNASRGDYQTKEQCADVFQYLLPSAKASSVWRSLSVFCNVVRRSTCQIPKLDTNLKTGLAKLRRVLRAIRKHFPQPPDTVLVGNTIDKFLDDPALCEDKLSEEAGSDGFLDHMLKIMFSDVGRLRKYKKSIAVKSEPYLQVYRNLYYFLAQSEEMSASDKWPGFVLTKEGEDFVQHNASLFKYDLLFNPLRFETWQQLANIYDEARLLLVLEVDLLLNDGSKHINVAGWRKNASLSQRVDSSRRRSRRCLLMSLALAKTPAQQCEIHELLALVYYDTLQNVVPLYDRRSVVPLKDAPWALYCENSLKHFKKAFLHKQDWSYAFYMGKLCQKLGHSHELSLSYYDKAIALNPTAVDPVYRMHASRLKLLTTCGKQNLEIFKVITPYCFSLSIKDSVTNIFNELDLDNSPLMSEEVKENMFPVNLDKESKLEQILQMLYNDCLLALHTCVEGDLKHFHKARYMLSHALYKRGESGDLEKAKDELSFCFKSTRSSFTINMWEIDSMVKKGRRKTPGFAGNKKGLEVNLAESSRKFITCIRKYLLFYLKLLEETGDICTLERAYASLRADKRFSLCLEDLVPVAFGRYIKALISSRFTDQAELSEQKLEKIFTLFMEQGYLWQEICRLAELKSPEISESSVYGYLHKYMSLLERNGKLETLEGINEKIRKRFKNSKLSNTNSTTVFKHASVSWYRSLITNLALITPIQSEIQDLNQTDSHCGLENSQMLCVDLQTDELWDSTFEDSTDLESLKTNWDPLLTKFRSTIIKKASDQNLDKVSSLLKSAYNFYRESSCVTLPSGVNIYLVQSWSESETIKPDMEGVEVLDLSTPRKLLIWAYTLAHGRYANISVVVKHCEETTKSKIKKASGNTPAASSTSAPSTPTAQTGVVKEKDSSSHVGRNETETIPATTHVTLPDGENPNSFIK
ncbi:hypothetical protein ACFE04_018758 [Oxalis oulophora]